MSSITLKVVDLIDKTKIQSLFEEKNDQVYFAPIKLKLNTHLIEKIVDKVISVNGKQYEPDELEKEVLKELDF